MFVVFVLVEPAPEERANERASFDSTQWQIPCPHHRLIELRFQGDVVRTEGVCLLCILLDSGE